MIKHTSTWFCRLRQLFFFFEKQTTIIYNLKEKKRQMSISTYDSHLGAAHFPHRLYQMHFPLGMIHWLPVGGKEICDCTPVHHYVQLWTLICTHHTDILQLCWFGKLGWPKNYSLVLKKIKNKKSHNWLFIQRRRAVIHCWMLASPAWGSDLSMVK